MRIVIVLLLLATPVCAQTPVPPQQSPAEIALQINRVVGDWAQSLVALPKQVNDLQQQLQAAGKELNECKAKLPAEKH